MDWLYIACKLPNILPRFSCFILLLFKSLVKYEKIVNVNLCDNLTINEMVECERRNIKGLSRIVNVR